MFAIAIYLSQRQRPIYFDQKKKQGKKGRKKIIALPGLGISYVIPHPTGLALLSAIVPGPTCSPRTSLYFKSFVLPERRPVEQERVVVVVDLEGWRRRGVGGGRRGRLGHVLQGEGGGYGGMQNNYHRCNNRFSPPHFFYNFDIRK